MLNSAIIKFNHHIVSRNEVIAAYEAGEALIGGVAYTSGGIIYDVRFNTINNYYLHIEFTFASFIFIYNKHKIMYLPSGSALFISDVYLL